jgi:hypothetical protein
MNFKEGQIVSAKKGTSFDGVTGFVLEVDENMLLISKTEDLDGFDDDIGEELWVMATDFTCVADLNFTEIKSQSQYNQAVTQTNADKIKEAVILGLI